jgi:hypothetical protein
VCCSWPRSVAQLLLLPAASASVLLLPAAGGCVLLLPAAGGSVLLLALFRLLLLNPTYSVGGPAATTRHFDPPHQSS